MVAAPTAVADGSENLRITKLTGNIELPASSAKERPPLFPSAQLRPSNRPPLGKRGEWDGLAYGGDACFRRMETIPAPRCKLFPNCSRKKGPLIGSEKSRSFNWKGEGEDGDSARAMIMEPESSSTRDWFYVSGR